MDDVSDEGKRSLSLWQVILIRSP